MSAQTHRSNPRILGRRTLERDHQCLAERLQPGYRVLDIGCGSGAITVGIAKAVGPRGSVVGVDRDEGLLEMARAENAGIPNLRFQSGDATSLAFGAEFDIVTAARTLQWIADPSLAISKMKQALRPGGLLVVLDYSHTRNQWEPSPPDEFKRFYEAFLAWRRANGWDNEMADHLPNLFRSAGLTDIQSHVQTEVAERGEPDFDGRAALWSGVIEHLDEQLVTAGFSTKQQVQDAYERYVPWAKTELVKQTLAMSAVTGIVP
ncbi:MAG TPA: methyltransferase domain-containing protein [Bryobacteraceae bacterium]|nr:methyltransferase domain-containing protein [Bryobacteraceae bacterium]